MDAAQDPTDEQPARPPRKLVLCLDGTSNEIGRKQPTNPARVFQMLLLRYPDRQVAYYDPGVGTLPSPGASGRLHRQLSLVKQLVWGAGLRANLADAYGWLMDNWLRGDEIHLFGFSRGAYTARALAGMLQSPGLMRPGSENLIPYAVAQYARHEGKRDPAGVGQFSDSFCWGTADRPLGGGVAPGVSAVHSVPIRYVGLWDTVEAAGLAHNDLRWPFTATLDNVVSGRHAVALDETRRPFRQYLNRGHDGLEEAWFAGIHTDVGGRSGVPDGDDDHLARVALRWVVEGAGRSTGHDGEPGLVFRPHEFETQCQVEDDFAAGRLHANAWPWRLLPARPRVPDPEAAFHHSVRLKAAADPAYRRRVGDLTDRAFVDGTWPRDPRA